MFYTIDEDNKIVNIIRFIYGRRDWINILKKTEKQKPQALTPQRHTMKNTNSIDEIIELIAASKDKKQIQEYLKSLLTSSETKNVSQRWKILKGLYEGKSQRKVAEELGVSLCNVTRGARELKQPDSGLRKFLKRYFERL